MNTNDLRAMLTAVYGSALGATISYGYYPFSRISPCVSHPNRCYEGLYNFFGKTKQTTKHWMNENKLKNE